MIIIKYMHYIVSLPNLSWRVLSFLEMMSSEMIGSRSEIFFWNIEICQSESAKMCDTKFWKFKKKGEEIYLTWFVVVEVTQKQTVTTRMIMQMVKTDVINSTSAKLNSTPFNLKKYTWEYYIAFQSRKSKILYKNMLTYTNSW